MATAKGFMVVLLVPGRSSGNGSGSSWFLASKFGAGTVKNRLLATTRSQHDVGNRTMKFGVTVLMSGQPMPMETAPLEGRKILIVEDEAPIALNLASAVQQAGGIVIGPVASVAAAHAAMADNRLDGALLDIRLRNETSFPLADVLVVLNIPFVFVSGLSSALMPYTHRERLLFDKPYEAAEVIAALAHLVRTAAAAGPRANDAPAGVPRTP
jgi:CheY-like chemotaxis protein